MADTTKTDGTASEWSINDDVVRLREWGTDRIYVLPSDLHDVTLGSRAPSTLVIADPSGKMSGQHARLVRDRGRWIVHDLDSKNGIKLDGARRTTVELDPGVELGIGGVTVIAESGRSIELRSYVARLLGWGADRIDKVDQALRLVRAAASRRNALVLAGDGDLAFVARGIHRRSLGPDRPFVVVDPRRGEREETVRSAESYALGITAIDAAAGGTVCMFAKRLPSDFRDVLAALREPSARFQLVVCGPDKELASPLVVPGLGGRDAELERVIIEFAEDAVAQLDAKRTVFSRADRAWVREHGADSLAEIEKATLRLVAIRETRSLAQAATVLGMSPVSLRQWIGRRRLPLQVDS